MLINKLKLNYFGRLNNREIELKPGVNLIYGENEAGKSTIHSFIKGMLFGIERLRGRGSASKEDIYTRYLPWDYPGAYSGSMDIRIDDKEYRLLRSFHANDKSFTIIELATGREVKLKEGLISELLPGLTESTFKNTISIEQLKAPTDSELAIQVRNYIANLSIAKSKELDVAKAVSMLTEQKKRLEATQNTLAIKALQVEIEEGLSKEERMDELTIQLRELLVKEQQLRAQKEAIEGTIDQETLSRMEQLPAIIERYKSYQELLKQEELLNSKSRELSAKIEAGEKEALSVDALREDITKAQRARTEHIELEKQSSDLLREEAELSKRVQRNLLITLVPSAILAIAALFAAGLKILGLIPFGIILAAGGAAYFALSNKSKKQKRTLYDKKATLEQMKKKAKEEEKHILNKYGISHSEELSTKLEEAQRKHYDLEHAKEQQKDIEKRRIELEDSRDRIYEAIMKYLQYFIRAEELSINTMHQLQEEIRRRKQETSGRLAEIIKEIDACRLRIERLRWEISTLEGNEEQLLKNQEKLEELIQKQKEGQVELEAVKLALSSIQELSADIHDSFGNQLNQAVSEVISEVTGEKYSDLKVDEKLEVKVAWNGNYVLLDRLSAGTIDQVYFALRLAVADLLLGKDQVPLLFDDSFALYDDERVKKALLTISDRKQIILFTCHRREKELLEQLNIPYHYVDLNC